MTDETENKPKENKVWISCRATEGCPGTYAVMGSLRNQNATPGMGQFNVAAGGKIVRYRCCTCNRTFTITT